MIGQDDLNRVLDLVAWWLSAIKTQNALGFFDINKISEGLASKLLNEIYGYNLENLNHEKNNYPGIDLGDKTNRIGFQISSRMDSRKFMESLEKFAQGPNKSYCNGIRFLILSLGEKPQLNKKKYMNIYPGFDSERHILTGNDLLQEIRRIYDKDRDRFFRIKEILEIEIAEKVSKKENLGTSKIKREKEPVNLKTIKKKEALFKTKFILLIAIIGTISEFVLILDFSLGESTDFPTNTHGWFLLILSLTIEYSVYAKCLQNIVDKLGMFDSFVAWIPVFNILLMLRITRIYTKITAKKILLRIFLLFALLFFAHLFVLIFFPFLLVLFFMILWSKIAMKLYRSSEFGLLAGLPVIGKFAAIHLAYK